MHPSSRPSSTLLGCLPQRAPPLGSGTAAEDGQPGCQITCPALHNSFLSQPRSLGASWEREAFAAPCATRRLAPRGFDRCGCSLRHRCTCIRPSSPSPTSFRRRCRLVEAGAGPGGGEGSHAHAAAAGGVRPAPVPWQASYRPYRPLRRHVRCFRAQPEAGGGIAPSPLADRRAGTRQVLARAS